jgi:hypothetical protein
MATLAMFRAMMPEFNNVSDILVTSMMGAASLELDPTVWGQLGQVGGPLVKSDVAHIYLSAHKLAMSPFGQNAKMVVNSKNYLRVGVHAFDARGYEWVPRRMKGSKITDKDNGYRQTLRNIKALSSGGQTVRVGVNGDATYENGMPVEAVGAIHEFGLGNNPERSFLRAWVDENINWFSRLKVWVRRFIFDGDAWTGPFGEHCVAGIKKRIEHGIPPALAEATIKAKDGNATPLINTELLINSIEYDVGRE